jgi:hypothetical protein
MKLSSASLSPLMVALVLVALPATSSAQTPTPLPQSTDAPGPTSATPPPPPTTYKRERAISSEVAASLAAAMPKYNPPKPPPPKPVELPPDLRETDKPKNGIVRLPNYVVRESKSPVFRERDINTQQGLANIAKQRYLTETDRALSPFTIPLFGTSPEQRAMAMYAEDERLKNIGELNDAAGMVSARDKAQGAYIKRDIQASTMRTDDYGWKKEK